MDYRQELRKMEKHREEYYPALQWIYGIFKNPEGKDFPMDITDYQGLAILLELIDLEYLDYEAFIIKKGFNTIERVLFAGREPLTDKGKRALIESESENKKNYLWVVLFAVIVISCIVLIFVFF